MQRYGVEVLACLRSPPGGAERLDLTLHGAWIGALRSREATITFVFPHADVQSSAASVQSGISKGACKPSILTSFQLQCFATIISRRCQQSIKTLLSAAINPLGYDSSMPILALNLPPLRRRPITD